MLYILFISITLQDAVNVRAQSQDKVSSMAELKQMVSSNSPVIAHLEEYVSEEFYRLTQIQK